MRVVLAHLVNGMTIIGKYEDHGITGISQGMHPVLHDPYHLAVAPGPQGQVGLQFVPFLSLMGILPAKKLLVLRPELLITEVEEPPTEMVNHYLQETSGIQIAQSAPSHLQVVR